MIDVVDALLTVLEPGGAMATDTHGAATRQADSGALVDYNFEEPFRYDQANRVYAWAEADTHLPDSAGPSVREDFMVRVVYIHEAEDEEARQQRYRAVSVALDTRAHLYLSRLAANRSRYADGSPAPWLHVAGVVDQQFMRAINTRGVALVVTGHRRSPGG